MRRRYEIETQKSYKRFSSDKFQFLQSMTPHKKKRRQVTRLAGSASLASLSLSLSLSHFN